MCTRRELTSYLMLKTTRELIDLVTYRVKVVARAQIFEMWRDSYFLWVTCHKFHFQGVQSSILHIICENILLIAVV